MKIYIKRAYDEAASTDGYRVLVDRLWPRGISKERLKIDDWCEDVAPSDELRKWFGHDPAKFDEFASRYIKELEDSGAAKDLLDNIPSGKDLTLIYSAKDTEHNQAVVIKYFLESL